MRRILIIEDDVPIGDMLEEILRLEGYRVSRAYSGTEALLALAAARPDLALLDLMLPGLPGEEVLPKIQGIPVIVLSAKMDIDSKVSLLLGGAADYMTKPFDAKELLARIAVALRKSAEPLGGEMVFGPLRLNTETRQARTDQGETHLTRTEFAILKLLMENPARVVAKSVLLDRISLDTPDCTENSLKMHVSNLRKKLRDAGAGDVIEAVWGIGFKLKS